MFYLSTHCWIIAGFGLNVVLEARAKEEFEVQGSKFKVQGWGIVLRSLSGGGVQGCCVGG